MIDEFFVSPIHTVSKLASGAIENKIDQWSGRALCLPRGEVDAETSKRKELDGPCLYFLVTQVGVGSAPRVYVGEADGFRSRIKTHLGTKDW
jgi:hypothetical protein